MFKKKSQYRSALAASRPPAAMEALCWEAKPMIKGLSMAEEETAARADVIYTSQHKGNITQVLMTEKKIFVLWGREGDLIQSPPFHAG